MFSTKPGQPRLYERSIGGAEAMMAGVVGVDAPLPREPLQIHCYAEFTASTPSEKVIDAFKNAWKALRLLKSPDVATTLKNGNKTYQVPSDEEVSAWIEETFIVAANSMSVDEAIKEMHQRPEWRPVLYILPHSQAKEAFQGTLIFFISHWRTEASGVYLMMDQLFDYAADLLTGRTTREALANHKTGSETQLLTPGLEDMMMPERESTAESKERVEKRFKAHDDAQPTIEIRHLGDFTQQPGLLHWTQRIYTPESTAAIVAACKKHSVSVNGAVHSAFIGAIRDLAPADQKDRAYASVMPAEVRRRLPSSSPYRSNGCWNSAQMLALVVPASLNFLERATSLREQYAVASSDAWVHEDMRATTERLMQPSANYPPRPKALAWITCFGVLDNSVIRPEHGPLSIQHVGGWADNTGPGFVLTVWTFKGRLTLQITRNAAFHEDKQIDEFQEKMDQFLGEGLGVDVVVDEVKQGEN